MFYFISQLIHSGMCLVGKKTVDTFDEFFYNATISGCDQVLAKDCSGRYKMAVLAREEEQNKVTTETKQESSFHLRPSRLYLSMNHAEIQFCCRSSPST